ncbi:hypothetical protein IAR55_005674 [Kwoniella newhampshirensis]|uniref:Uncharacterized protein n=1 Tax=Kwoniella newhampshirensis TaxID=1651941 RepID=A0AAW0YG36_9TREE
MIKPPSPDTAPISWTQLIPLCLITVAEATTWSYIFPFVTEFLTSIDTPKDKIGLYAGIAEGSVVIVEAALPISMAGFSRKVGWWIFWRASFGITSAQIINRIIIAEALIRPSVRGWELSNPYLRLLRWLGGGVEFLWGYPYALPCLVTSALVIVAVLSRTNMLKEVGVLSAYLSRPTLTVVLHRPQTRQEPSINSTDEHQEDSVAVCLRVPNYKLILSIFCLYQFVSSRGLDLHTCPRWRIGIFNGDDRSDMVFGKMVYVVTAPFIMPMLQNPLETKQGLLITTAMLPVDALMIPLTQLAATKGRRTAYGMLAFQISVKTLHAYPWPICDQYLGACFDDSPQLRATEVADTLVAGFPAGSFGRQVPWIVITVMVLPTTIIVAFIPGKVDINAQSSNGYGAVAEAGNSGVR